MPFRLRTFLPWGLFLLAAAAAGFAVHRLHRTAQREIAEQQKQAVMRAHELAVDRIDQQAVAVRATILAELAGLHGDGLAASLQRWDAANELVVGTFMWDAARGFNAVPAQPAVEYARLPALWQEFREWRLAHPDASVRVEPLAAGIKTWAVRTLDNPNLPAGALRYQAENLDLIADEGGKVDPWAGWAVFHPTAGAPWILWYQPGPDALVRGCIVNPAPLAAKLQDEIAGGDVVYVTLAAQPGQQAGTVLAGYQLSVGTGELFKQKVAEAQLTAVAVAALLGLFLLGAVALGLRTVREARDAGRKINFVTQVSHELRTPLTSIRMFSDMLAGDDVPAEKRLKFARMIGTESLRLSELIERLLAFNAMEKGARKAALAPVDVTALVQEVKEETAARVDEAGLQVALELPPVLRAQSDRSIVKQALLNLVDNACKYATAGRMLGIAARADGDRVVVRVADAGPGIPVEVRDRLFEPFVQGGTTLTTKSPGVGLGLSLARGLLRQAQGDLVFVPSPGGAVFEIHLSALPSA